MRLHNWQRGRLHRPHEGRTKFRNVLTLALTKWLRRFWGRRKTTIGISGNISAILEEKRVIKLEIISRQNKTRERNYALSNPRKKTVFCKKNCQGVEAICMGILGYKPTTSRVTKNASDGRESRVLNLSKKSFVSLMCEGMEGWRNLWTRTDFFEWWNHKKK